MSVSVKVPSIQINTVYGFNFQYILPHTCAHLCYLQQKGKGFYYCYAQYEDRGGKEVEQNRTKLISLCRQPAATMLPNAPNALVIAAGSIVVCCFVFVYFCVVFVCILKVYWQTLGFFMTRGCC